MVPIFNFSKTLKKTPAHYELWGMWLQNLNLTFSFWIFAPTKKYEVDP